MRAMRTQQNPLCKCSLDDLYQSNNLLHRTISTQTKECRDVRPTKHLNSYAKRRALSPISSPSSEPRLSDEILDLKTQYLSSGGQGVQILEQLKILEEESRSLEASVCYVLRIAYIRNANFRAQSQGVVRARKACL